MATNISKNILYDRKSEDWESYDNDIITLPHPPSANSLCDRITDLEEQLHHVQFDYEKRLKEIDDIIRIDYIKRIAYSYKYLYRYSLNINDDNYYMRILRKELEKWFLINFPTKPLPQLNAESCVFRDKVMSICKRVTINITDDAVMSCYYCMKMTWNDIHMFELSQEMMDISIC